MKAHTESSVRRLLKDFNETLAYPLSNVSAWPLEDDLYTWHGSVRGTEDGGFLNEASVHFSLTFDESYPHNGPLVRLFTPVPHPSVRLGPQGELFLALWDCIPSIKGWSSAYTVQSILVQLQSFLLAEDMVEVSGSLQVTPEAALERALNFECSQCPHTPKTPYPPFPTSAALSKSSRLVLVQPPALRHLPPPPPPLTPKSVQSANLLKSQPPKTSTPMDPTPNLTAPTSAPKDDWTEVKRKTKAPSVGSKGSKGLGKGKFSGNTNRHTSKAKENVGTALTTSFPKDVKAAGVLNPSSSQVVSSVTANTFSVLCSADLEEETDPKSGGTPSNLLNQISPADLPKISKAAKKNASRSKKRQNKHVLPPPTEPEENSPHEGTVVTPEVPNTSTSASYSISSSLPPQSSTTKDCKSTEGTEASEGIEGEFVVVFSKKGKKSISSAGKTHTNPEIEMSHQELIASVHAAHNKATSGDQGRTGLLWSHPTAEEARAESLVEYSAEVVKAMGPLFGSLPQEALVMVLCSLTLKDLGSVMFSCRGLRRACEDGALWKALMERRYPASSLTAHIGEASGTGGAGGCGVVAGWKHAFMLELHCLVGELCCFHTRNTLEECTLGFPLRFTVNPKTAQVDYVEADMDLLSVEAFHSQGVRSNPRGEEVKTVLPLFLTAAHFSRAIRPLETCLITLCSHLVRRGGTGSGFNPIMALDALPKLLNTAVVLLADGGMSASEKALDSYCQVHRLLVECTLHYNLWGKVDKMVQRFVSSESMRTKAECPSLGNFIPLLSLTSAAPAGPHPLAPVIVGGGLPPNAAYKLHEKANGWMTWKAVARLVLNEAFDRKVLWICKHDPSLADRLRGPIKGAHYAGASSQDVDEVLLKGAWEASKVSLRLMMFHVGFLRAIARPEGCTLAQTLQSADSMYGRPSRYTQRNFQVFVKRVLAAESFDDFFDCVGVPRPSGAHMTAWLRQCWKNSLRKNYHKENTNFSKIHSSGVSKILLKGESYTAPPNLKEVTMEEHWRWTGEGVRYLDASVLAFDQDGDLMAIADYQHTNRMAGALQHSGDIIEDGKGTHIIRILLSKLSPNVKVLYFTMSGYMGASLGDFRLPVVSLTDSENGVDLCDYVFEQTEAAQREFQAVVMCRLFRTSKRSTSWTCQALGKLCMGEVRDYDPIIQTIRELPSV